MTDPFIGKLLGSYRVKQFLAQGGMGKVYLAQHEILNRAVAAAKVMIDSNPVDYSLEDFTREAQIILELNHPNIIRLLDFGFDSDNIPFICMTYAPYGRLTNEQLPLADIIKIVDQITSALQYAHDKRIVHRDIKPNNFLIGSEYEILVSDFGIAKRTTNWQQGQKANFAGTLLYMAPEQINGDPQPASDQYSLGVCLYTWLSGRLPFNGNTMTELMLAHLNKKPPSLRAINPQIPESIEQIVEKALSKKPEDRFRSIRELGEALRYFEQQEKKRIFFLQQREQQEYIEGLETIQKEYTLLIEDLRKREQRISLLNQKFQMLYTEQQKLLEDKGDIEAKLSNLQGIIRRRGKEILFPQLLISQKAYDSMVLQTIQKLHTTAVWQNYGFVLSNNAIYLAGTVDNDKSRRDLEEGIRKLDAEINPQAKFTYLHQGKSRKECEPFEFLEQDLDSLNAIIGSGRLEIAIASLSRIVNNSGINVEIKFYGYSRVMQDVGLAPIEIKEFQILPTELPGIPLKEINNFLREKEGFREIV